MPLYNYKCEECQTEEEKLVSMNAESPLCSSCQSQGKEVKMKRQISKPSFILKGNHWARDNYGLQDKV